MATAQHTSSAFEQDLTDLNLKVVKLGELASRQLSACLRAMSDFQETRVDRLIERDVELDQLEAEVNDTVRISSPCAPRSDDLRRVPLPKPRTALSVSVIMPATSPNGPNRSWQRTATMCHGIS